jgi:hypothetical protein
VTDTPKQSDRFPAGRYAIKLPGPGLGEVAVGDVVEFLRGVVDLVAHGSAIQIAKPMGTPGRRGTAIEEASKIRLVGLKDGSLIAELAPAPAPPVPDSLGLDVQNLSQLSLDAVFDTVEGKEPRRELAAPLIEFARRMAARRPGQPVVFIDRRTASEVVAELDGLRLKRLETLEAGAATETRQVRGVSGRIFEANVDTDEARLRTLTGEAVKVQYEPALEGEIKRLLGDRASVRGDVTYDPATNRVRAIHATEMLAGDQLEFEGVDFWHEPSLSELADNVTAQPVTDPDDLHFEATDAEWDELYGVLRSAG